jgi:hypothetical protein
MEESYTCSVFPDLSYRYLDNGYALEITGKSSVEAPLHPFLQAAWIAGDAFVDFQITLEGMPSDPADLFDFFSGPILGLSVIPTVETDGPFISYIHQFPWGSAQYPYWDSHIRIGAAHGGNVWPVKQESSFSFTLRPFLFTYDRMIPIRPILVGSERPEFIDTPEPAAWQLALVGLGLLAWRVKKPSFLRS